MAEMETLSQAISRLAATGYERLFRATQHGTLIDDHQIRHDPATMSVEEIVRFEGASDPDDQAILYALSASSGQRGLYSSAYGPGASGDQAAVFAVLPHLVRPALPG